MRKSMVFFVLLALFALVAAGSADAATTGKVQGTVRDAQTGEPLPGANVVIDGTQRGATTDANGYYIILLVDPATYSIKASMVGYDAQTKTDVKVQSDFTSTVDFTIRETALQLGEMVVVAEAPPVEPDKTTSKYLMSAEDLEAVPIVRNMQDFMELQAGVSVDEDGNDIMIRGGDREDVAYMVDGIRVVSTDHGGGSRTYRNVNKLAVQELTVISGGYGAEYGNAKGGVVSMITRDGGSSYHGLGDYQFTPSGQKHWGKNVYESPFYRGKMDWDNSAFAAETITVPTDAAQMGDLAGETVQAHKRLDYTDQLGHRLEGNLSGPLTRDLTFFASSRWQRYAASFPDPDLTTPFNTNNTGKLSYGVSPNLKVKVGVLYDRRKATGGGASVKQPFRINTRGMSTETDLMLYATVTHSLSPKTFYEVRAASSKSQRKESDSRVSFNGSRIDAGGFTIYDDQPNWTKFDYRRLQLRVDLSSQVNKQNFAKAGFEVIRYNNWYQRFRYSGPTQRYLEWYSNTFDDIEFFPGQTNKGLNPMDLSFYVSDKIEFEGMIVNAGLRWEIFFQNTWLPQGHLMYPSTMYDGLTRGRWAPEDKFPALKSFQPRLGVSYPITDKSLVRFFYGQYRQRPTFRELFFHEHFSSQGRDSDLNDDGQIGTEEQFNNFISRTEGNPNMVPEVGTQAEIGLDWNFVGDYVLAMTSFYKSEFDTYPRGEHYWYDPNVFDTRSRAPYSNSYFRDTRGVELSLKKKFSNMFAFNLAYNLQWSEQGRYGTIGWFAYADRQFVENGHYFTEWKTDPVTGAQTPKSLQEMALEEGREANFYVDKYADTFENSNFGWSQRSEERKPSDEHQTGEVASRNFSTLYAIFSADGFRIHEGILEPDKSEYDDKDKEYWERANALPGYPGTGEGNLLMRISHRSGERAPRGIDRRSFGSMMFLFATPSDYGPMGGQALGNLRMNLVYRLYTGTRFTYSVGNVESFRYGPMHTRMDLNAEKMFGSASGTNVTLAIEVYNLFNQRDPRDKNPTILGESQSLDFNSEDYQAYGITALRPTRPEISDLNLSAPELNDIVNSWDAPREMTFSVRVKW